MTFNQLISKYKNHSQQARRLILAHSKYSSQQLYLNIDKEIDFDYDKFKKDMNQYLLGKPLQYIIGYEYFADLKIFVKEGVYIPRPETEMLVYEIISNVKTFFDKPNLVQADICSGSGAIACALNKHLGYKTYGLELSEIALEQAYKNNIYNKTRVVFKKSNIDEYLIKNNIKVDILVSNPPYIKPNAKINPRVKNYEPHMALFDNKKDGTSFYKHILKNHNKTTKKKALISFEIGYDQKEAVKKLIKKYLPNQKYKFIYDYNNFPRGVIIFKAKS